MAEFLQAAAATVVVVGAGKDRSVEVRVAGNPNAPIHVKAGGAIHWKCGTEDGNEIEIFTVNIKGAETPFRDGTFQATGLCPDGVTKGIGENAHGGDTSTTNYVYGVVCEMADGGTVEVDPDIVVGPPT